VLGGVDPSGPETSSATSAPGSEAALSPTLRRTANAVSPEWTLDSIVGASSASIARSTVELERPSVPELVRPGATEAATVIRRVTLPRALSRHHRPPSTFAEREAPTRAPRADEFGGVSGRSAATVGSPSTHAMARASVVTLADVAMSLPTATGGTRSNVSVSDDPVSDAPTSSAGESDVEMNTLGAPPRTTTLDVSEPGAARRRPRSVVPPGTGALLDVVRRSARPDLQRRTPTPTATPTPAGHSDVGHSGLLVQRARVGARDEVGTMPSRSSGDPATIAVPSVSARSVAPPSPPSTRRSRSGDIASEHLDLADDRTPIARIAGEPDVRLRPAEQVAEQFMTALSETVRRSPAPLPTTFRPMADAIAGPRPVMLSTDPASRRALRSVGKVAATTGDTIHLDERAIPSARLAEVMAHELTHIAHPSPAPRFFDDIDDSPEERRAEAVARVMARSPLAPAASLAAPTRREGDSVLRRSPASTVRRSSTSSTSSVSSVRPSSPGTVTADQLAAQITGSRSNPSTEGSGDVLRRSLADASPQSTSPAPSASRQEELPTSGSGPDNSTSAPVMSGEQFLAYFRDNLSEVMGLIEDRMIIELERRGGRTWGVL
jgi:hypothetical protein